MNDLTDEMASTGCDLDASGTCADDLCTPPDDAATAMHATTPHLVEGDYFPEESESVAQAEMMSVAMEVGSTTATPMPTPSDTAVSRRSPSTTRAASKEDDTEQAAAQLSVRQHAATPPRPAGVRKVVLQWADACDQPHPLVRHIHTFHLTRHEAYPGSDGASLSASYTSGGVGAEGDGRSAVTRMPATLPPPPLFRAKQNSDGTVYQFCKAQRPAGRFTEWRRHPRDWEATPFARQTGAPSRPPPPTLFAALTGRRAGYTTRREEAGGGGPPTARLAGRAANVLQLPLMCPDTLYDRPLIFPAPPHG